MGDRVAVLKDGLLRQVDTPIGLFARPVNVFVAGFIGSPAMNLLQTTVDSDGAVVGGTRLSLTPAQRSALTGPGIVVGVRPEGWTIGDGGFDAVVEVVEELGSDQYLYCRDGDRVLTVRTPGMSPWQRGQAIALAPRIGSVHLFDAATGDRLP
ncbi:MAG: multiple sugar transport system ATP-binding protein [Actinomycetota bacterium]|nr:multiple sugar transport system ATP-binding protein [Actinomycetota bacterium]